MTGTEVAVVGMNQAPTFVDPRKVDYEIGKKWVASQSLSGPFAGKQLNLNGQDGDWLEGWGDNAKILEDLEVIVNVPNTLIAWEYWPDNERASYPFIAAPFAGGVLPSRAEVDDKEETKYNKLRKEDVTVWEECAVLLGRNADTGQTYHFVAKASKRYAVMAFLASVTEECASKPGMLPVVKFSSDRRETEDGSKYRVPKFEVVDWVKATKEDNPGALLEAAYSDEAEADEPKVKAKVKSRKRAAVAVEDDDDEDEDEGKPVRRRMRTVN